MKKIAVCFGAMLLAGATVQGVSAQPPESEERAGGQQGAEQREAGDGRGAAREDQDREERPRDGGRGAGGPGFGGPGFGGPGGGPGMMMRAFPVMAALDADKDGIISAEEIGNAAVALKSIDKNSDGRLTEDELRPTFPRRDGGPGFGPPGGAAPPRDGEARREENREGNPEEAIARLMQADANGDGKLGLDEVNDRMRGLVTRADADGDGFATREELVRLMRSEGGRPGAGRDRNAPGGNNTQPDGGERGDANSRREGEGRGFGGPGGGPEAMIDRMFEFDADKDGKLTREELKKMAEQFGAGRGNFGGASGSGAPRGGQSSGRPARPPAEE